MKQKKKANLPTPPTYSSLTSIISLTSNYKLAESVKQQKTKLPTKKKPFLSNKILLPISIIVIIFSLTILISLFASTLSSTLKLRPSNPSPISTRYYPEIISVNLCIDEDFDNIMGCKIDATQFTPKDEDLNLTLVISGLPIGASINTSWLYIDNIGKHTIATQQISQEESNENIFNFKLVKDYNAGWLNGNYEVNIDFMDSTANPSHIFAPITKTFTVSELF